MNTLLYTIWNANPEIFTIPGINWPVRWYGLFFAVAFIGSQFVMGKIYKAELRPQKHLDILTLYIIIATVLGARFGHMLFYEPKTIIENPIEILKVWNGGLASHGGAIGILLGMWLYCRKTKEDWKWIFDRLIIVVALSAICIRTGNLMNSEILGKPTDAGYGVVFVNHFDEGLKKHLKIITTTEYISGGKDTTIGNMPATAIDLTVTLNDKYPPGYAGEIVDFVSNFESDWQKEEVNILFNHKNLVYVNQTDSNQFRFRIYGVPRHAAQVYEGLFCLFLFILFFYLWIKKRDKFPKLFIFGLFCVLLFTERFLDEMIKENQVNFENNMALNMGQILSIPFILVGIFLMIWSKKKNEFHKLPNTGANE